MVMVDSLLLSPSLQHLCYDHLPTSSSVINLSGMVTLCHYKCTQLWRAMKRTNQNINLSMLCRLSALFVLLLVMSKLGFKRRRKQPPQPTTPWRPKGPVCVLRVLQSRGGRGRERKKGRQKEEKGQGSREEKVPAWWVCGTLHGGEQVSSPLTQPFFSALSLARTIILLWLSKEGRPGSHLAYHVWVHWSMKRSQFKKKKKKERLPGTGRKSKAGLPSPFPVCLEHRLSIFNLFPFECPYIFIYDRH